MKMHKQILQINFVFDGTREEFESGFMPMAKPISEQPGLLWKVWMWGNGNGECGGVYLFENEESVQAYVGGPIGDAMKNNAAITNLNVKSFDVVEKPTAVTRGPV